LIFIGLGLLFFCFVYSFCVVSGKCSQIEDMEEIERRMKDKI